MRVKIGSLLERKGELLLVEREIAGDFAETYPEVLKAQGPVNVNLTIVNTGEGFLVTGDIKLQAELRCSRCLKPYAAELVAEVDETLRIDGSVDEEDEDSDWNLVLDGDELDLTDLVQESLLVNIPMKTVCREDCPGICPTCGADLASEACECPSTDVDIRLAPLAQLLETSQSESQERRKDNGSTKEKTFESKD